MQEEEDKRTKLQGCVSCSVNPVKLKTNRAPKACRAGRWPQLTLKRVGEDLGVR